MVAMIAMIAMLVRVVRVVRGCEVGDGADLFSCQTFDGVVGEQPC